MTTISGTTGSLISAQPERFSVRRFEPESGMAGVAWFSIDEVYRYVLMRIWDKNPASKVVTFCMLNPSTANECKPDPTITRCIGFAKAWGFGGLAVVNLFALRSTDPAALRTHINPIGPENDLFINQACGSSLTVCAWGNDGALMGRGNIVRKRIANNFPAAQLTALRMTKMKQPEHPLYLPKTLRPILIDG